MSEHTQRRTSSREETAVSDCYRSHYTAHADGTPCEAPVPTDAEVSAALEAAYPHLREISVRVGWTMSKPYLVRAMRSALAAADRERTQADLRGSASKQPLPDAEAQP